MKQIKTAKTYTAAARSTAYKAKRIPDARLLRDADGAIIDDAEKRPHLDENGAIIVVEKRPPPSNILFLCNMNRSQTWKDSRGLQGWGEGYLVSDGVATPYTYDLADGVTSLEPIAGDVLSVGDFAGCDVASRKMDVVEWLGLEANT